MNKSKFDILIWIFALSTLFQGVSAGNDLELDTIKKYNNIMISLREKINQDYDIPVIQIIAPKNMTYAATVWYCGLDNFSLKGLILIPKLFINVYTSLKDVLRIYEPLS